VKKKILLGIILLLAASFFYLNFARMKNEDASSAMFKKKNSFIVVMDELGRKVKLPSNPKRIVVLTSYPAEVICALGAGERIIGLCKPENEDFPELRQKESVGKSAVTPNLEKILELQPDVVIAYQWTKKDYIDKLEKCNIPVLCFRAWTFTEVAFFTEQMGKMLNKQERAKELCQFVQSKIDTIKERTKDLKEESKPTIFYETFTAYQSTSVGKKPLETAWGTFMYDNPDQVKLDLVGGINCVGAQPAKSPILNAEWVIEKNPTIIIKVPRITESIAIPSNEDMEKIRKEIMQREGLQKVKAVQEGKVYILHSKMCAGPRQIIGLYYYAKWLQPNLFHDLDPITLHKEMLKKFWGLEMEGTWGYPEQ